MARYLCTVKMRTKTGGEKYATVTVTADMDLKLPSFLTT